MLRIYSALLTWVRAACRVAVTVTLIAASLAASSTLMVWIIKQVTQ